MAASELVIGFDADDTLWRNEIILAPLGRPIDVHLAAPGKLYVLEYTRQTELRSRIGWLPGRILELKVKR
jgi:hypothetical protein